MKSFLMTLITACLLTAAPITITYAQNFDKADKAYEAGDYTTAAKEFRLLAEQGDAGAQFNLGYMYSKGEGVVQDYAEAMRWYRLAAEQDYADAQFNLGLMHFKGQGVPQDYVLAHMWFNIAAASGHENALKARDLQASLDDLKPNS